VDFGAFVKLEDGIEGLVHISQLADRRVENPSEVVQPGQKVKGKVVNLDSNARRIGLSIRAAQPQDTTPQKDTPVMYSDPGPEGVTIGDMVEGLEELLERTERQGNE